MSGGINIDEMKRQQELVTLRAIQKISQKQNLSYEASRRKTFDLGQAVKAAAILLGVGLGVMLLLRAGIL